MTDPEAEPEKLERWGAIRHLRTGSGSAARCGAVARPVGDSYCGRHFLNTGGCTGATIDPIRRAYLLSRGGAHDRGDPVDSQDHRGIPQGYRRFGSQSLGAGAALVRNGGGPAQAGQTHEGPTH